MTNKQTAVILGNGGQADSRQASGDPGHGKGADSAVVLNRYPSGDWSSTRARGKGNPGGKAVEVQASLIF